MIPSFEDLMRPMLEIVAERGEMTVAEVRDALASRFRLTEDQLRERIPSGRQTTWMNRVHWSKQYLTKSGAVDSPRRAVIRANEVGRQLLLENPDRIDKQTLAPLPAFQAWTTRFRSTSTPGIDVTVISTADLTDSRTPREQLDQAYGELKREIVESLLERVKGIAPEQFERLVVDLMTGLGYGGTTGSGEHLGGSGDGGVDGVIREDALGLELIYLQAKRWEGTVSRPTVQAFAGSLEGFRARKGVLITTSSFTRDALEYVRQIEKRIVLIDGHRLCELMYEVGLGVSTDETYVLRAVDNDFFDADPD